MATLKHIIALLAFSIAVVFFISYAQYGIQWIIDGHDWIDKMLGDVFSGGQAGNLLRGLIALLSIPLIVGLIPSIIYWMVRRSWLPYFMEIVWVVWLLQAGALIATYHAPVV
jgi:hypothetical protein